MRAKDRSIERKFFLCLFAALSTVLAGVSAASSADLSRNVTRILPLSRAGLCVITEEKGGIFLYDGDAEEWRRPEKGLPDAYIYSATSDPGENLFLTTPAGVYRSDDRGDSWREVSDLNLAFIVFSPDGTEVFLKVWGKGLFRTSPGFFSVETSEKNESTAKEIEELESRARDKMAGMKKFQDSSGLLRFTDEMMSEYAEWKDLQDRVQKLKRSEKKLVPVEGLPEAPVQSLVASEKGEMYAGFFGKGVFRSADNGFTWRECNEGLENRYVTALGMDRGGVLFAGTYGNGPYCRERNAESWSPVESGISGEIVQCVAFGPGGETAMGTRGSGPVVLNGLKKSARAPEKNLKDANVHAAAFGESGVLYAGVYGKGLFESSDRGGSWRPMPFAWLSHAGQIEVGPENVWYVGVKGLGLIRIENRGARKKLLDLPFSPDNGFSMAVDGKGGLFVGDWQNGVFVSADRGETWSKAVEGLSGMGVNALRSDWSGRLYAASSEGDALFEYSGGVWRKIVADEQYGDNYTCWDIRFFPNTGGVAYGLQDILIADPGGMRWERSRFGQHFKGLWMGADGKIRTRRMMSLFVLENDGEWKIGKDTPLDMYSRFVRLDDAHYAAIRVESGVDLLQWTGNGFERIRRAFEGRKVLSIACDQGATVLAGTENGLWASEDRLQSWRKIDLRF